MNLVNQYNKMKSKQRKVKHRGQEITLYKPQPSNRKDKKLSVYVEDKNRIKKIDYGSSRYEDFTTHKDKERRKNYCQRSKGIKGRNDITSANYWSRTTLWNC